jgi:hypothetical protein
VVLALSHHNAIRHNTHHTRYYNSQRLGAVNGYVKGVHLNENIEEFDMKTT